MSIDDPRPTAPTAQTLAEDLDLSNQEGNSWFVYRPSNKPDTLLADLYTEQGQVDKTFTIRIAVEETPSTLATVAPAMRHILDSYGVDEDTTPGFGNLIADLIHTARQHPPTDTSTEWTLRGPDGELVKRSFTEDEAKGAAQESDHWTAVRREVTEWIEDDR